jgi:energy-coupling factor transport system ATP-binding protein
MNALFKPTDGTVLVNGVDTKKKTTAQIAKSVGYVFQNPDDQIFNNNVRAELEYMPKYLKLPEDEIKRRAEYALKLTKIDKYMDMNPFDIPYPIRKFVTIAAIICVEPKYLILDEPTAGQDSLGIRILEALMDEMNDKGVSVVTITHDMEFVANNFKRVVVMAHANVIADDSAREIFWNDAMVKESGILKPQLAQLAERLELPGKLLYQDELIKAVN